MTTEIDRIVKRYFNIIYETLKTEDAYLGREAKKFEYHAKDLTGGLFGLDEKHIQYLQT
jgi:hypothetical protein